MKIACVNCMVPGTTLTEKAEKLKKWGFDGISLQIDDSIRSDALNEEILALKERTGVQICEFSFLGKYFGHHMSDDPEIKTKALAYFFDSIAICKQVGAVTGIGYEYRPQDPLPLFDFGKPMAKETEKTFLDILRSVGTLATENGVTMVIEAINRYETKYVNNLADCRYFIDKLEGLKVGAIADFFHLAIEEKNIPESILASKGYIKEVHLGDNNRLLPGYGSIDWRACIRALKEIEYDGYLALECGVPGDPEVLLPECAAYLKNLIETV